MRNITKRLIIGFLATILSLNMVTPTFAKDSSDIRSDTYAYTEQWNATDKVNTYKGNGKGCFAFVQYMFDKLFGHSPSISNKENMVTPSKSETGEKGHPISSAAEISDYLLENGAIFGDAVIFYGKTKNRADKMHVIILGDYDLETLEVFESNIKGYSNNRARNEVFTYEKFLELTLISPKYPMSMRIVHSKLNINVEPPIVETPVVETPVVEAPAVETPVVETPVVETPAVETPAVETPAVEPPVVEPPVVEPPISVVTKVATKITSTNARFNFNIAKKNGVTVEVAGVNLGKSPSEMHQIAGQSVPASVSRTYKNFNCWFDSQQDCSISLEPRTTYYYQGYCIVDGVFYMGNIESFTTSK